MILQFGSIINPLCIARGGDAASCAGDTTSDLTGSGGLINFGSNIIRLVIIGAGIFALVNFVLAGIGIIGSQGDPKALDNAKNKIVMTVVGLVIVAGSFILAGVAGLLLFGNAGAFLSPTIYGPEG